MAASMDYGHTNSWRPKFKSQSHINIWDLDIHKGLVFCRNNGCLMENMDKELTVPIWVRINWLENTPNAPKFMCPNCLPMPKSLGFQ